MCVKVHLEATLSFQNCRKDRILCLHVRGERVVNHNFDRDGQGGRGNVGKVVRMLFKDGPFH